jgi:hypothetical protein
MSRTTRKVHRYSKPLPDRNDEFDSCDEWWYTRLVRGLSLQGSTSPPRRSGGYCCDWCHSPNGKKYDKRRRAKLLRREASDRLYREWLQWERFFESSESA